MFQLIINVFRAWLAVLTAPLVRQAEVQVVGMPPARCAVRRLSLRALGGGCSTPGVCSPVWKIALPGSHIGNNLLLITV